MAGGVNATDAPDEVVEADDALEKLAWAKMLRSGICRHLEYSMTHFDNVTRTDNMIMCL